MNTFENILENGAFAYFQIHDISKVLLCSKGLTWTSLALETFLNHSLADNLCKQFGPRSGLNPDCMTLVGS